MSLVFAAVCLVAVSSYAWASQVAPYATPWSMPWHVVRSGRATAAANAAIRLAIPVLIAVLLLWPYPWAPGSVVPVVPSPQQATVSYHPGQLGMRELIWVLVAMAAAATVALAVVLKRALADRLSRRVVVDMAPEAGIGSWTDEGISEILAESDPRRAILACYAVAERRLAAIGIKRRSDETALEYARRLLERSGAPPQPIATLTELFHLAGYSSHNITESMRQSAVDSLQAIREAAA